ncbi:hypothetical protein GCM10009007_03100 [Formosimonas limnophila]|uniref:Uncharacterized protein n=1 Tax=Formosimonas limnophila TaxID=1384487 RepID=A0A8J3CFS0_9BURK|nr:hypothetical protein [Formosimonas limnophila]GHA66037.1 hypothetical protein GCM10009007_03100 [Formosimonas limnophila]
MSNQTKQKRKNKKYQGRKNVRCSFGRTYAVFNPIIDWFARQIDSGETLCVAGVPSVVTANNTYSPTWEAIEALTDFGDTARDLGVFDVPVGDLDAFKKALKHDMPVPQSTFESAFKQLLNLRDAVMRMPAAVQVRVAEVTQLRLLNGVV